MKNSDCTRIGTSLRESKSLISVKIGWGIQQASRGEPEKSQKVSDSHESINTGLALPFSL